MAGEKKIYRYTAGGSGSSTQIDDVTVVREKEGLILRGSNYLLGKLPFTKNEFEHWSKAKRIILGYLLWLVVIPIWPLVVLALLWNNPRLVRRGTVLLLLTVVAALWFWGLYGIVRLLT